MGDGKVVGAGLIGLALVIAALVVRQDRTAPRYEVTRSGFNNAVWVLDRTSGSMALCVATDGKSVVCKEAAREPASATVMPAPASEVQPVYGEDFEVETPAKK